MKTEIKQDELKEKVKSLSKEQKNVLEKTIKDPTLNDIIKAVLEEYEVKINSFTNDIECILYTDEDENLDKKKDDVALNIGSKKEK